MNWDLIIPIIISLVTVGGSGALVKVLTERQNRKAEARKTLTEGEVARSAEDREWVKQARTEAAEAKAEAKDLREENTALSKRVDELEDNLRRLEFQLQHCPGGSLCPMKPAP